MVGQCVQYPRHEQNKKYPSTDGRMKINALHILSRLRLSKHQKKMMSFAVPSVDREISTSSPGSQTGKDRHHVLSPICGIKVS